MKAGPNPRRQRERVYALISRARALQQEHSFHENKDGTFTVRVGSRELTVYRNGLVAQEPA